LVKSSIISDILEVLDELSLKIDKKNERYYEKLSKIVKIYKISSNV
jgi:hypothetical protein